MFLMPCHIEAGEGSLIRNEEDPMKGRAIGLAVVAAALLSFASACVVADRPGYGSGYGRQEYYYYPDQEVYFYPGSHRYYWQERGEWRYGAQAPSRFVLRERDRVRIDLDREPHTDHARIRQMYPPNQERREDRRDDRRDDRKEDRRGY
jgi:hypothetical protein